MQRHGALPVATWGDTDQLGLVKLDA